MDEKLNNHELGRAGEENDSFRDSMGIVTKEGKRNWIYPKQPKGRYYFWRSILSVFLLAILFGVPFIKVNNTPLFLFDIVQRRFILFGMVYGPHDFYLLGLAFITSIVFILLFTAVFGRLFCGWVCPQTVFMEMVFRKIDYWVEGNEKNQRKLNEGEWNREKVFRKGVKYIIYFILSFLISNMLLAWIIGVDELAMIVSAPVGEHLGGFIAMMLFSTIFYWIFSWFREQACILVCPYGRLQSVLLDPHSIVIAYDDVRGEPREKIKRNVPRTSGDCIDCKECVAVCPTGIDIRNGTQLECVNCTACIDACDYVMERIKKPKGLIRYDSLVGIKEKRRKIFTPRVIGYSVVQIVLLLVLTGFMVTRSEVDVTLLRTPGMFYQDQPDGKVSNLYDLKILNKTFDTQSITLQLVEPAGEVKVLHDTQKIGPQEPYEAKVFIIVKKDILQKMSTPISLQVFSNGVKIQEVHSTFLGPVDSPKEDKD